MITKKIKKLCKRLKIKITIKRGSKRIYKSEKVLLKQIKKKIKKVKRSKRSERSRRARFGEEETPAEESYFKRKRAALKKWSAENPKYTKALKYAAGAAAIAGTAFVAHKGLTSERGKKLVGTGYSDFVDKTSAKFKKGPATTVQPGVATGKPGVATGHPTDIAPGVPVLSREEITLQTTKNILDRRHEELNKQLNNPDITSEHKAEINKQISDLESKKLENEIAQASAASKAAEAAEVKAQEARQRAEDAVAAEKEKNEKTKTAVLTAVVSGGKDLSGLGPMQQIVAQAIVSNKDTIFNGIKQVASTLQGEKNDLEKAEQELQEAQENGDEVKIAEATIKVENLKNNIEDLEEQKEDLESKEQKIEKLSNKLLKLQEDPEENAEQINKLTQKINELTQETQEIQEQVAAFGKRRKRSKKKRSKSSKKTKRSLKQLKKDLKLLKNY